MVDLGSGAVLLGQNDHVRRPPASISKLMTALVTRRRLRTASLVTVSAAAAAMPARKLNIRAGQRWKTADLLQAMLLCSCNDIARALAEKSGGSVGGFGKLARAEAERLGTVDSPVLQDPAGLDDEFSVGGGNRVSAFDMAIIARAFEADTTLAAAVRVPKFAFRGPDGALHQVVNHNRLLGAYEGAIGVKTGFTKRSGGTLVAAATRRGRTILVVILGSPDIWYHAPQLLDYGFNTPVTRAMVRLPTRPAAAPVTTRTTVAASPPASTVLSGQAAPTVSVGPVAATVPSSSQVTPAKDGRSAFVVLGLGLLLLSVLVVAVAARRRVVRLRAATRARLRAEALTALVHD